MYFCRILHSTPTCFSTVWKVSDCTVGFIIFSWCPLLLVLWLLRSLARLSVFWFVIEQLYPVSNEWNFMFQLQYLPPPWGDCRSTPMDSEYFSTYSITACRIDCETRYLLENCNCRMVHMPGEETTDQNFTAHKNW